MRTPTTYRHIDAALLRASVHTADVIPPLWPFPDVHDDVERCCAWLIDVWMRPDVAEAIAVASPVLADRIEAVRQGQRPGASEVRRMLLSVARYLVRMRGRATPFGAFAGVAPLHFGATVSARWRHDHMVRIRPDAVWLADVIGRLEMCPELRRRLLVTANNLAVVRGDRLVVPWRPSAGDRGQTEASMRYSLPVRTVLAAAQSPISVDALVCMFAPGAAPAAEAMVAELITQGALLTNLNPPSTTPDGLGHVLRTLREVEAAELPSITAVLEELRLVQLHLNAAGQAADWVEGKGRRAAAAGMRKVSDVAVQPLVVDLRLAATVMLPTAVVAEAESAAGALLRLAPDASGDPGWREYHAGFLERYGLHAVVPIRDLVDPCVGLGFPRHFDDEHRLPTAAALPRRDQRLLELAQQAALDGAHEVVLDDAAVAALSGEDDVARLRPAPHIDLCVDVRAPSAAALAAGAFTLAVTGIGRTAVATSGRFLDVLAACDRRRTAGLYETLPSGVESALSAQLVFPPRSGHAANVVRSPRVLPHVIALGEHSDGGSGSIGVSDLAATADGERMYLVSLSRRQIVEPVLTSAASRHVMPPLARLLFELPRATATPVALFAWGAAESLPFRPRVRYSRSILSAARWRLPIGELPGRAASRQEWTAAWTATRHRRHLPASVYIGTGDRRLRLDLDEPMDLDLLRAHCDRTDGLVTLVEAPKSADYGWLDGRAHEVVIPMASNRMPAPRPVVLSGNGPLTPVDCDGDALPGSRTLFAKLYGDPDVVDVILTRHLPELLAGWDKPPLWWFVRYRDPAPHLRLRLHHLDDAGQAVGRVSRWAADLRRRGLAGDLVLDTYHPETGRYGSGSAMAAAEAFFAADSAAALAQIVAVSGTRGLHPQALTAASLVDLAGAVMGSREKGLSWLVDHPDFAGRTGSVDRAILRQAVSLAEDRGGAQIASIDGGAQVVTAWQVRQQAAAAYTAHLDKDTHVTPTAVLGSLLHMHHVRARGLDPADETLSHRLARAIALATVHRQSGGGWHS